MAAWYERAFGPWYGKLYPHRDREEAARTLQALLPWLPESGCALDVACGSGRHLEVLLDRGREAYGVDRSWPLLRGSRVPPGRLVRADMRALPYADRSFTLLLLMFTSFGYFEGRGEERDLLCELARVTRMGGTLILDYVNAGKVRAELVPRTEREVDGHRVIEERRLERTHDGERMVKTVTVQDPDGTDVDSYREEVSLYEPSEIGGLLAAGGWSEAVRLGDYAGSPWREDSPRLVVVARRGGA